MKSKEKFVKIFLPKFGDIKKLAWVFYQILVGDKEVEYGSLKNPNVLYDPIIKAFSETIIKLRKISFLTQSCAHD